MFWLLAYFNHSFLWFLFLAEFSYACLFKQPLNVVIARCQNRFCLECAASWLGQAEQVLIVKSVHQMLFYQCFHKIIVCPINATHQCYT
jgi:hypothetical protein